MTGAAPEPPGAGWNAGRAEPASLDEPAPPEAEDESRLGIERSRRVTVNWLGFADPTPHRARESELEQAALSMALVGSPEAPSDPSPSQESSAGGGGAAGR